MSLLPGLDRSFALIIWADGPSFAKQAGVATPTGGVGFSIHDRDGRQLFARSKVVTDCDNNEAEVRAILEALRKAEECISGRVKIHTDALSRAAVKLFLRSRPRKRSFWSFFR
ncbi:MAG: ribonuclease H family protein [Chitinophagales bacterium]